MLAREVWFECGSSHRCFPITYSVHHARFGGNTGSPCLPGLALLREGTEDRDQCHTRGSVRADFHRAGGSGASSREQGRGLEDDWEGLSRAEGPWPQRGQFLLRNGQ